MNIEKPLNSNFIYYLLIFITLGKIT